MAKMTSDKKTLLLGVLQTALVAVGGRYWDDAEGDELEAHFSDAKLLVRKEIGHLYLPSTFNAYFSEAKQTMIGIRSLSQQKARQMKEAMQKKKPYYRGARPRGTRVEKLTEVLASMPYKRMSAAEYEQLIMDGGLEPEVVKQWFELCEQLKRFRG